MKPNVSSISDLPAKESLTIEFKSDPKSGLPDRVVVEAVVGMTNAEGGTIYIGINDDGSVCGVRTARWLDPVLAAAYIASHTIPPVAVTAVLAKAVNDLPVLVIEVPKSIGIVATHDGKVLKRRLKIDKTPETSPLYPQEFLSRLSEIGRCDYSAMVLPNSSYEDLDDSERKRLREFIQKYQGERALSELEDEDLDKALGLVRETASGLVPTVAGLIVIGKKNSIKRLLPGAGAVFQHLSGTDVLANEDIELPVLSSFESLLDRFNARNAQTEITQDLVRIAIPTFSEQAFREALVNAFCHRDYTILNRISVRFMDDGLEITSPGGFVSGVTLENLMTVEPHPRNALLADIFKRLGLAERTGRGIDRIFERSLIYGRPCPDYSESSSESVRVIFPKCEADIEFFKLILQYQKQINKRISVPSLMILGSLLFSKRLSFEGIVKATQLPAYRLKRHVETLVEDGLLETTSSGENREFILSSRFYKVQGREIEHVRLSRNELMQNEELVMKLIQERGTVSRGDVMQLLGINGQSAYRILRKLTQAGRLLREGDKRSSIYRACAKPCTP